jgi:hypothetical protein
VESYKTPNLKNVFLIPVGGSDISVPEKIKKVGFVTN